MATWRMKQRHRSSWTARRRLLIHLDEQETDVDIANVQAELSSRKRAEAVVEKLRGPGIRWAEKLTECRWGSFDGFTAVVSILTGAVYLIAEDTGSFYRTASPETTTRLVAANPREVIAKDRNWLFQLFARIPCGPLVLQRYSNSPHKEEPKVTTPTKPMPEVAAAPRDPSLIGIKPKSSEKRIVLVETTKTLELRPDQVVALVRMTGVSVPDKAAVSWTAEGYVRLQWVENKESVEE